MADAVLLTYNLETNDPPMHTYFDGEDAIEKAWGLWEAIKDDCPGWHPIVAGSERAERYTSNRRLRALGIEQEG